MISLPWAVAIYFAVILIGIGVVLGVAFEKRIEK